MGIYSNNSSVAKVLGASQQTFNTNMSGPIEQLNKLNNQKKLLLSQKNSVTSKEMEEMMNQLNNKIMIQQNIVT